MSTTPVPRGHLAGSVAARAQQLAGATAERVRRATHPADPAAALFQRIGWRLAAMYAAALAAMLLVMGLVLYLGVQQALLGPVTRNLQGGADQISAYWPYHPPRDPNAVCSFPPAVPHQVPYIACYSPAIGLGTLQGVNQPPAAFTDTSLIQAALNSRSGHAWDTVEDTSGLGAIRRYAEVVPNPFGPGIVGVVMVGIPIQGELTALHVLLVLLLLLGALALAGAVLGGVVLSRRALAPARLALQRQQAFIGDAAHELRTPLTLARANAELLLHSREKLDPDDAVLLEDIVAEIGHMSKLATSMLRLARLDEGQEGPPEREVVDLGELVRGLARRAESLAAERGLTLSVEAEPSVLVLGDRTQLEEVALILLDNAVKYNRPGGSVLLSVTREGGRGLLTVADSGPGIAAEHLARLGERFYRVDKSRSRELGGAGLGLSIARRIAAAHGGTLTFASEPKKGTRVTLSLPAVG
ncbi:MAG TPA: ATP-binding protein [Ktedonobacterales bacterium]